MKVSGAIFNGLDAGERKKLETEILRAATVFDRLEQLFSTELEKDDVPSFNNPNWACETAYQLGYKKGLTKALKYVIITP